ncbi:MAG: isoleucine--tRNA ligase [Clostridiales bacterium]|jgi:isoleucyl-tRNA synthetase|nr:isoleucine--tRNA ligase [Clostridiales bacterium]
MYEKVSTDLDFVGREMEILEFWRKNGIIGKSHSHRAGGRQFTFYDGPPTANGKPHIGHVVTRAVKDIIPRFWSMKGFDVMRKAGWDTHGLPVELEVEKLLGINGKPQIEEYGVGPFIEKCKESVWKYKSQWQEMSGRVAYWADMENAYVTYENSYIESVWWSLKQIWDKGLIYKGHKVVPYCPRCGTALSSHEVAQGYKDVQEKSIFVKFRATGDLARLGAAWGAALAGAAAPAGEAPAAAAAGDSLEGAAAGGPAKGSLAAGGGLSGSSAAQRGRHADSLAGCGTAAGCAAAKAVAAAEASPAAGGSSDGAEAAAGAPREAYFLAWTTTPWTLPSNVALVVHPDYAYALAEWRGELYVLAKELAGAVFPEDEPAAVLAECRGGELVGIGYEPLFGFAAGAAAGNAGGADAAAGAAPGAGDGAASPGSTQGGASPGSSARVAAGAAAGNAGGAAAGGTNAWIGEAAAKGWYVCADGYVTLAEGSGIVHTAPAFGEDDARVGRENGLPFVQLVDGQGLFVDAVTPWKDMFVKDADPLIIEDLERRGLLFRALDHTHSYPFCWRCDTPLLYYARDAWFIKMTELRDRLVKNNDGINWLPDNIKHGRFGNFLENVVDWGLSRERYWGTPLPIWECSACGSAHAVGSVGELKELGVDVPDGIELHKPYIDAVKLRCPSCGALMERVPEVIDCWYDSGAMPFAQWHYPFENRDVFERSFPADFISEAIDQTRGWFYTLLAISTAIFGGAPFRNAIVLGHVQDKDGLKMSKHKGNVVDPQEVLDRQGADAVRWYFFSNSAPWLPCRFYADAVGECQRKFIGTLWNTYAFYVLYAEIDKFVPTAHALGGGEGGPGTSGKLDADGKPGGGGKLGSNGKLDADDGPGGGGMLGSNGKLDADGRLDADGKLDIMDRWVLSRLNTLVKSVNADLSEYRITEPTRSIQQFVDELSNWYVRRCRERFWQKGMGRDKESAFMTLYTVLSTLARLLAPFVPFMTEMIYQNIVRPVERGAPESVHLCDFPEPDERRVDAGLEAGMRFVLDAVTLGRACRNTAGIKNRQPLSAMYVQCGGAFDMAYAPIIAEELNVKEIELVSDASKFTAHRVKPQLKALGPRYGKLLPKIGEYLAAADGSAIVAELEASGAVRFVLGGEGGATGALVELRRDDLLIETVRRDNFVSVSDRGITVVLDIAVTAELAEEGFVREIVSKVQNMRKEAGYEVQNHIRLSCAGSERVRGVLERNYSAIAAETLADGYIAEGDRDGVFEKELSINAESVVLCVQRV